MHCLSALGPVPRMPLLARSVCGTQTSLKHTIGHVCTQALSFILENGAFIVGKLQLVTSALIMPQFCFCDSDVCYMVADCGVRAEFRSLQQRHSPFHTIWRAPPTQPQSHLRLVIHAQRSDSRLSVCPLQLCKSNNELMHVIIGSGNLSDPNFPCPASGEQYPVRHVEVNHMSACYASVSSMQPRTADAGAVSAVWLSCCGSHGCVALNDQYLQHDRSNCIVQGYTNGVPNSNTGRRLLQAATKPYDTTALDQCQAKVDTLVAPYMVRRCGFIGCMIKCNCNHSQHQLTLHICQHYLIYLIVHAGSQHQHPNVQQSSERPGQHPRLGDKCD